jgi:hypothetical protein
MLTFLIGRKQKKIFFQKYDPCNVDPNKRPFVLIMMDDWMIQLAKRLTPNSAWAVDSTFKTNQYNMPLFGAVCPNEKDIGMPVFLMLCSNDKNSGHEGIALQLTMTKVFEVLEDIRPNAIVIDKNKTEYDSYKVVIEKDPHCWEHGVVGGTQIKYHLLLSNFHTKKAWVENLLPKVSENERDDLYKAMCTLMDAESKIEFEENYNTFKENYGHLAAVMRYVDVGWAGQNCYCRTMWTRFGRLFPMGLLTPPTLSKKCGISSNTHYCEEKSIVGWMSYFYPLLVIQA